MNVQFSFAKITIACAIIAIYVSLSWLYEKYFDDKE